MKIAVPVGTAAHQQTVPAILDLATIAPRAKQHATLALKASTAQTQTRIQAIVVAAELHALLTNVLLESAVLLASALVLVAWITAYQIRKQT